MFFEEHHKVPFEFFTPQEIARKLNAKQGARKQFKVHFPPPLRRSALA